jgi:hypothetical protein
MKTSKIILIGFFSVVGLFLLSLLIQVDPKDREPEYKNEAMALPPFKHLVLQNSEPVTIIQAQTDSAFVDYATKNQAVFPEFELKGDTLILTWAKQENNWGRSISCSQLKSVTVKGSRLDINEFAMDTLKVEAEGGEFYLNSSSHIGYLNLDLKQKSFAHFECKTVNQLETRVVYSNLELQIEQIGNLRAELQDSSSLTTWKVLHTDVRSDETSRYYSR